jgi:TPR repeat protein
MSNLKVLEDKAAKGNAAAMFELYRHLENGTGGVRAADPAAALSWLRRAVDGGASCAINQLGIALRTGTALVPRDPVSARQTFRTAIDAGSPAGLVNLAVMLHVGEGGEQNLAEARSLYARAVAAGAVDAEYNLALMLELGEGGAVDVQGAIDLHRSGAARGDIDSLLILGELLSSGRDGVPANAADSACCFARAAALAPNTARNCAQRGRDGGALAQRGIG